MKQIESEAYKRIQTIQGDADAKATAIYAGAYNPSPRAARTVQVCQDPRNLSKGAQQRHHIGVIHRQRPVPATEKGTGGRTLTAAARRRTSSVCRLGYPSQGNSP